jgi:hypothetical protein
MNNLEEYVSIKPVEDVLAKALFMSPDNFLSLETDERQELVFVLLQSQMLAIRAIEARINAYEAKVREMVSPEGIKELQAKFFESLGGGGMFGGLF